MRKLYQRLNAEHSCLQRFLEPPHHDALTLNPALQAIIQWIRSSLLNRALPFKPFSPFGRGNTAELLRLRFHTYYIRLCTCHSTHQLFCNWRFLHRNIISFSWNPQTMLKVNSRQQMKTRPYCNWPRMFWSECLHSTLNHDEAKSQAGSKSFSWQASSWPAQC